MTALQPQIHCAHNTSLAVIMSNLAEYDKYATPVHPNHIAKTMLIHFLHQDNRHSS